MERLAITLKDLRRQLDRMQGAKQAAARRVDEVQGNIERLECEVEDSRQAQTIINTVARETQSQLEYQLGDLGSMAQAAIFEDPYRFGAEFEISGRSGTVCRFYFERGGGRFEPLAAAGGGPVDVASWALRPSILPMSGRRKTLWLDEPFRFLSRVYQPRAAAMLREVSQRLKIQIVMITHSADLLASADRVFTVRRGEDGTSWVEEEDNNDGHFGNPQVSQTDPKQPQLPPRGGSGRQRSQLLRSPRAVGSEGGMVQHKRQPPIAKIDQSQPRRRKRGIPDQKKIH